MAKISLKNGENQIIRKTLLKSDGTALPYSDLANAYTKVNIYFQKLLIISYLKGTAPEIRQGSTANELEFEITKALTASLLGEYTIEYILQVNNADYDVDTVQVNIFAQELEVLKNG